MNVYDGVIWSAITPFQKFVASNIIIKIPDFMWTMERRARFENANI